MNEKPSQHSQDIKAERILISQTIDLTPFEVSIFLASYGITREEYNYVTSKYKHVIEAYYKERAK